MTPDWRDYWADLSQHKAGWALLALTYDRARLVYEGPGEFRGY